MIQTNRSGDITVQSAAAPGAAVSGYRPETPRILIYSPDSYGLGHFRRCLKVSEVFKQKSPDLGILLVTGSPHAGRYRLPNGVDLLSLPAVVKTGDNQYEARSPDTSFREISELRQNLISDAVRSFKPDLILVDHNPVGLKGELRKTLAWIKDQDSGCQIILGMRDIIDEPESVLASWAADNIHEVLEDVYDRIFIYGTPEVFDPISGYQFGPKARAKSSFTGFITGSNPEHAADWEHRPKHDPKQHLPKSVFVTVGGGEDGSEIIDTYLRMQAEDGSELNTKTTIVTGPFCPPATQAAFGKAAMNLRIDLKEFAPDISSDLRGADLVISMGGYNTVTELLALGRKALIIPRVFPRKEQLLRAQKLSDLGVVDYVSPDQLTPEFLFETISSLLRNEDEPLVEARRKRLLPLDGTSRLASFCASMLESSPTVNH